MAYTGNPLYQKRLERFWTRLGGRPELTGKRVLEVGCGFGTQCIDTAKAGARKVVGVDVKGEHIESARKALADDYPGLINTIEFFTGTVSQYSDDAVFDIAYSQNTFEHIFDVEDVLNDIYRRLNPGGKLYLGFGPLYNSPFGSHMVKYRIPWGHLVIPKRLLFMLLTAEHGRKITSIRDLSLNGKRFAEYVNIFNRSDFEIDYFEVNKSTNPVFRVFNLLRSIPFLREFFTVNIYCILIKPGQSAD